MRTWYPPMPWALRLGAPTWAQVTVAEDLSVQVYVGDLPISQWYSWEDAP